MALDLQPASDARSRVAQQVSARLDFARDRRGRTFLARQYVPHPFHITRPFRLEGDPAEMASLYLQSSSGGLYGGDRLGLAVSAAPDSQVHLTTQASSIVHAERDLGPTQTRIDLEVGAGALLEWLPDPIILMAGAELRSVSCVRLGAGARLVVADAFLDHAPWNGTDSFRRYRSELRIEDAAGRPLALDRMDLRGDHFRGGPAAMGRYRCHALLIALGYPVDEPALDAVRARLSDAAPQAYAGVSALAGGVGWSMRALAREAVTLRAAVEAAWRAARLAATGSLPGARRK